MQYEVAMKTRKSQLQRASWQLLRALVILVLSGSFTGCQTPVGPPPTLDELKTGDELKASGQRLIQIPLGVHRLTPEKLTSTKAILAVHGHKSRGFEWVSSLHQFAETGAHVYWLRWDWNQCPKGGANNLEEAIQDIQTLHPGLKELEIFGHSYGGVIATLVAQTVATSFPMQVHAIASPLAGMGKLNTLCPPTGINKRAMQKQVSFTQWRTQHKLDGAFKDEATDPQRVTLPGAKMIDLPDTFNGRRLGHNWSVSYSVTQWLKTQKEPDPTENSKTNLKE